MISQKNLLQPLNLSLGLDFIRSYINFNIRYEPGK